MSDSDVTLGEVWRQGEQIKTAVEKVDAKLDGVSDRVTAHDGDIARLKADVVEMRSDQKAKRVTTSALAGLVAAVITVVGEVLGHLK